MSGRTHKILEFLPKRTDCRETKMATSNQQGRLKRSFSRLANSDLSFISISPYTTLLWTIRKARISLFGSTFLDL